MCTALKQSCAHVIGAKYLDHEGLHQLLHHCRSTKVFLTLRMCMVTRELQVNAKVSIMQLKGGLGGISQPHILWSAVKSIHMILFELPIRAGY